VTVTKAPDILENDAFPTDIVEVGWSPHDRVRGANVYWYMKGSLGNGIVSR